MTRPQKVVRLLIRLLTPVFVLGGIGALAGTLASGFEQQRDVGSYRSPSGRYTATLVSQFGECDTGQGSEKSTVVYVERRVAIFKTGLFSPFCLNADPSHLVLQWESKHTLRIECHGCRPDMYEMTDTNWGKLRFVFDLDHP